MAEHVQDPAGVKALLDQLRLSQAWQDTLAQSSIPTVTPPMQDALAPPTGKVAALLSQLQTSSIAPCGVTEPAGIVPIPEQPPQPDVAQTRPQPQNVKSYTLQQSLPALAQLCDDTIFVSSITQAGSFEISCSSPFSELLVCVR
jgi:hypothetical protein